jgi:GAF domain-containing protein/DNA-binding response OmpR family regulator
MSNTTNTPASYTDRLVRRLVPALALVISGVALVTIFGIANSQIIGLRAAHESALERAVITLVNTLQPLINTTVRAAADERVARFATSGVDTAFALNRGREIVSAFPQEVIAARLLDTAGKPLLEVLNVGGFPQVTIATQLAVRPQLQPEPAFFDSLNQFGQVTIGRFRLQRNLRDNQLVLPVRPALAFYAPVFSAQNELKAVYQVEIDPTNFLNLVNRADVNFIDPLPGRHVILTTGSNLVVADSAPFNPSYLEQIEASAGNLGASAIYDYLRPYTDQAVLRPAIAEWAGPEVISVAGIRFENASPVLWRIFILDEIAIAYAPGILASALVGLGALVLALMLSVLVREVIGGMLRPVEDANVMINELVRGERPQVTAASSPLTDAILSVSRQIGTLSDRFEQQVQRRNRDLRVMGRIGYETAVLNDLDVLLKRAINLICAEMGFYHAQVFLIDPVENKARLAYSRGEAGEQMLARRHALEIGSASVIGAASGERRVVIINDVEDPNNEFPHRFNPLLPDTRAEMALPLIVGDQLLGVLDIQSTQRNAFLPDDLPTFELLANQVAVAMFNAQLRTQTDVRMQQIDRLNRQLTRSAWQSTAQQVGLNEVYGAVDISGQRLSAPLSVRGEPVGTLEAALPPGQAFTEGDHALLQAIAERVAIAIENARLFQETQSSLAETSTLYELSQQLNESATLEAIVKSVVMTVAPDAAGGQLWLFDENVAGRPQEARLSADVNLKTNGATSAATLDEYTEMPRFLSQLSAGEATYLRDINAAEFLDESLFRLLSGLGAVSLIVIPLNMRGVWKGFVLLYFDYLHLLGERERRIFDALIAQAGVAVDNRLLLQQTEEALSRNEKLYEASRAINTSRTLADLVAAAVATSRDPRLDYALGLLEGDSDTDGWRDTVRIVARCTRGIVRETDEVQPLAVPPDSPLRRAEPLVVASDENITMSSRQRAQDASVQAVFPLFIDDLPIALFYVSSRSSIVLDAEDIDVYKALTSQMSTQIQNRRLLARTEAALNEATRLYVASRAISSVQDIQGLYNAIAGHLGIPFAQDERGQQRSVILTLLLARPSSRTAPELEYTYQWSSDPIFDVGARRYSTLDHAAVPIATLLDNAEAGVLVYNNLAVLPEGPLKKLLTQDQANAAVLAPVQVRQLWFGALIVHAQRADFFTEGYIRFVQAVADQIAVALENQNLLAEAQFERANLTNILATLPAGVIVLNPETYVPLQVNERARELLGTDVDYTQPFNAQTYRLYRTGTSVYYPDDELPIFMANELNQPMFSDDISITIDEETQVDLLVNAAPIYDNRQRKIAIVAAFQDITNLRALENTLQENLRETVALYETQRALSESVTLDELLDTVLGQLAMQQAGDVHIILADEKDGRVSLVRYLVNPLDNLEALRPILQPQTLQIDDINAFEDMDDTCHDALSSAFIQSALVVPLRAKTRSAPLGWLILSQSEALSFSPDQERVLNTLADMASTAIDNTFLFQSTQNALQETASLYTASTTINRSRDLEELSNALSAALEGIQPDVYGGYLLRDDGIDTLFNQGFTELLGSADLRALVTCEMADGDSAFIQDIETAAFSDLGTQASRMLRIRSLGAVNLRVNDGVGGRVFVGFYEPHSFEDTDRRFLNTVADNASVVIDNMVLLEQIQNTLQETSTLYQASRALIEASTPADIVNVAVSNLTDGSVNSVAMLLLDRPAWDSIAATARVAASWSPEETDIWEHFVVTPDMPPLWSMLSTDSVAVYDVEAPSLPEELRTALEAMHTHTVVVIPLRVAARAIGALWIGSSQDVRYSERELRVFQSFGEQASLSLEAARLLEQTERRANQLQTTAEISERVGQILDLDVLLPQVVNLIRERFNYDHVQVFLMDANDDYAVLRASTGEAGAKLLGINHRLQKGSASVIGQVTATREVTIAADTADARIVHKPNPYLPDTRSEIALPLIVKGRVVGALDVQSNQPNAFGDEDVQTLSTLAAQISIAIDNARLYEDAQNRANELGFLFDVTTAATAADSLDSVLQSIVERLQESLEASVVAIYLPMTYVDYNKNVRKMLKASAVVGTPQPVSELSEVRIGDAENLIGIVGSTMQSQIVPNIDKEVRYLPIAPGSKSAIVVPIASGSELVGLIALESRNLSAYTSDTLTLLLTLAGSLAAVIQNTLLVEQLQQSNEQLREVDRLKSQFLANMSHELRTPLNSIIGFSRVMLKGIDGPLTEMQEQDLTTIFNSGNHLLNLINDILDQAKIEANEMQLKIAPFEVKPMIESVKSMAVGLLKDKNLQLYVEVAPNLPPAYGDEFRTRQILLNLVSNAVKFTPEGSVTLRVTTETRNDKRMIRADVIDTGIGIAEKDMPILFEQFRQVDNSLTRTVGGTGLGLPISRALAELQGGELLVASEVGKGSTFTVTIPVDPLEGRPRKKGDTRPLQDYDPLDTAVVSRSAITRETQTAPRVELPPMPVKRDVLLIEDNKDMVDQFRRALQREGFEVQTADHPSYAEAMVGQLRPTMVIMDVNFANGVGWSILQNLKQRDDTTEIPIIVTTMSGEKERALELGANRFVQRPFMPDQLLAVVHEVEQEFSRQRILIIDDQPEAVRLLHQLLDEHGKFKVYVAESGQEGINMVARRRPDLVVLDLRMPGMDGFEVLNELRANPETANIPVVIVTGDIDLRDDEQKLLENIRILHKTDISAEQYNGFITEIKNQLRAR